jgi:hypothetical protein
LADNGLIHEEMLGVVLETTVAEAFHITITG